MKYKAVAFDYFGVIAGEPATNFNLRISEIIGVDAEAIKTAYHHHNDLHNIGKITWDELWTRVLVELNKHLYLSQVLTFVKLPKDLNLSVISLVKELKSQGYKVALLSNYSREGGKRMRESEHLDELFDLMLISGETGLAKPHPEAFQDLLNKLKVKAEDLIFIDDAIANTKTAEEMGITTILCTDINNIRPQLVKKGVL